MHSRKASNPAARRHIPRVAILIETSTDWSRRVIAGVRQYVRAHDFWHIFIEARGADEALELPPGWDGDGVIARVINLTMARNLEQRAQGIPVVNVSAIQVPDAPKFPRVNSDVAASAKLAVDYFLERGFRNFGYLSLLGLEYAARQQTAFVAAVAKAGGKSFVRAIKTHDGAQTPDWNLKIEGLAGWLTSLPKPVAILTWSGGREIIHACDAAGLRVPEEVAVLSGSDDFLCDMSRVPISGVQAACETIGSEAAALLHRLMNGAKPPSRPKLIPPLRVFTRQSTDTLAINDLQIARALGYIRENATRNINVQSVAHHAGVSRRLLEKRFMASLGRTPAAHIRFAQLDRAKQLLMDTSLSIERVSEIAGFGSPDHMAFLFRKKFKITPLKFRKEVQGSIRSPNTVSPAGKLKA
jgi:LacI family transcriptional regulator